MTTFRSLLTQLFADQPPAVHFHAGPQGQPAVCHDEHCGSPHLDVR